MTGTDRGPVTAPETAGQASHVVVTSPNKPRPDDPWAIAIADSLRRTEINYHREGSGPGSRFEGELLEDVLARLAIGMMRARQAEEAAPDPFTTPPGFHLITDNSGTRHLVDVGGVRYLTEERPGSWELAIRSGNWPAIVQLARNILGTTEADL